MFFGGQKCFYTQARKIFAWSESCYFLQLLPLVSTFWGAFVASFTYWCGRLKKNVAFSTWDFDVHTHLSNQWTRNHKFDQHQEAYLLWIIVTSKFTHACSFVILTDPGWRDKSKRSCFLSISFYLRWKFSSAWHRVIIYSIRLFRKQNGLEEDTPASNWGMFLQPVG